MVHLGGQKRYRNETFGSFNKSNFDNSIQCHMNDDYCLVFVDGSLLSFLFLSPPQKFEVATSLKHLLKGEWVPVINNKFDSAPTKQGLIDLN